MIYVSRIGFLTLALALVATVTFASGESDQPAAAAEKEMVLDPSTGEMVTAPEYGGTLTYARTTPQPYPDAWSVNGGAQQFVGVVSEMFVIPDWAADRREEHNPRSLMRGQLAESWEQPDPLTFIFNM